MILKWTILLEKILEKVGEFCHSVKVGIMNHTTHLFQLKCELSPNFVSTRRHSSRMRTTCMHTVSTSVATTRCRSWGSQMSVAGGRGYPAWCFPGGGAIMWATSSLGGPGSLPSLIMHWFRHCTGTPWYWHLVNTEARTKVKRAVRIQLECFLYSQSNCNLRIHGEIIHRRFNFISLQK